MAKPDTKELVNNFLKPHILKKFPDVRTAFICGSHGRALKNGIDTPTSSSDIDLVLIFNKVADAGFDSATRYYKYEDVGTPLGQPKDIKMIDINIHDDRSLLISERYVRYDQPYKHQIDMLSEGFPLIDRDNKAADIQKKAAATLAKGPAPLRKDDAAARIEQLKTLREALVKAQTTREARGIGLVSYSVMGDFALGINNHWQSGLNQINRYLRRFMPEFKPDFEKGMQELIMTGKKEGALALFDQLIFRGNQKLPYLPKRSLLVTEQDKLNHIPARNAALNKKFMRFAAEHCASALETSGTRGPDYYISTISALARMVTNSMTAVKGDLVDDGLPAVAALEQAGLLDKFFASIDEGKHQELSDACDRFYAPIGGMRYNEITIEYQDDLAYRVKNAGPAPRPGNHPAP